MPGSRSGPIALITSSAAALRTVLFWSHLAIGVATAVLVLLMSVTGVMLGFERQMILWFDGAPRLTQAPASPRLSIDSLLALHHAAPGDVASVSLRADPLDNVTVRFRDRERTPLVMNPYTGEDISVPPGGDGQAFFSGLRRWHRWVGVTSDEARATARKYTGAANLLFALLAVSGLYLWWPRRWTRAIVKSTTVFSWSLQGKPRDFNWHNSLGFWSAIPLFLIAATGVFISYQWPGRWLDRVAGTPEEREAAIAASRPGPTGGARGAAGAAGAGARAGEGRGEPAGDTEPAPARASFDVLARQAAAQVPEWRSISITAAAARDTAALVAVAEGNTYRPDLRSTLVLDAGTGAVLQVRDYSSLSTSRKIRAWTRFGHTGEVFGLTGQVLATLFSAVACVLVWTGIALSLRRFSAWWRRRTGVAA
ncbi:MAG: PepSY domain-containing protein [Gemmatimonadaceae bacterium]|nr:PepSY domain-containing protein [Gemmatimonadaceae bacterium]